MTLDEFRRHPAYDYYIITLVSDCHTVILKQIKYEKK